MDETAKATEVVRSGEDYELPVQVKDYWRLRYKDLGRLTGGDKERLAGFNAVRREIHDEVGNEIRLGTPGYDEVVGGMSFDEMEDEARKLGASEILVEGNTDETLPALIQRERKFVDHYGGMQPVKKPLGRWDFLKGFGRKK